MTTSSGTALLIQFDGSAKAHLDFELFSTLPDAENTVVAQMRKNLAEELSAYQASVVFRFKETDGLLTWDGGILLIRMEGDLQPAIDVRVFAAKLVDVFIERAIRAVEGFEQLEVATKVKARSDIDDLGPIVGDPSEADGAVATPTHKIGLAFAASMIAMLLASTALVLVLVGYVDPLPYYP